jgi:nitrite reductase/ring-hydroxylating ferredoxin subunit
VLLGGEPAEAARAPVRAGHALSLGLDGLRYAIPSADGAIIDRENEIILMRHKRRAYAFALSCPHQRTVLKWLPEQGRFQCPKHKSKYQPDGAFISCRATRAMDRHATRLVGRELLVDPAVRYRSDRAAAAWAAAAVTLP